METRSEIRERMNGRLIRECQSRGQYHGRLRIREVRSLYSLNSRHHTMAQNVSAAVRAEIGEFAAAMAEVEASRVRNGDDINSTEGVVGLTRWFEKMESVFSISNCTAASQVKFATCTLQDDALTWWNSHVKTTTPEAAHAMTWAALKKMMTDKYCPRGEIKKIETEMWNLKVKGTDVVA
ncbi:reverse transcriptase domain-containing protein [Tanacetum coccineum]|uniref:Reverse transcriptase domain-containing protein n=1 Tax=Tanacetum coccineum TaxID=301880 RepID=A0ABQ5EZZ7_9ASTR